MYTCSLSYRLIAENINNYISNLYSSQESDYRPHTKNGSPGIRQKGWIDFRNQIDEIEDLASDKDEKEDSVSSLKVQDQENAYDASVSDPLGLL